jgi:prepilin-type N-terminal cleavage/methylation domain-containing protein
MIKREDGFTLVELMITMVVFVLAIAAASQIFTGLLGQFKQQSKIAESNIEGIVGLEMMRSDIEQAGFGLPWALGNATYQEAVNDIPLNPTAFAALNDSPSNPPRAVVIGNGVLMNNSDVLVLKATSLGASAPIQKWTYIADIGGTIDYRSWGTVTAENLETTDHVIVVNPAAGSESNDQRVLVSNGGNFNTTLGSYSGTPFVPTNLASYLVYGISPEGSPTDYDPRMPFNRVDYYIKQPATMPSRCAPNTGVLYKGVIVNQDGSAAAGTHTEYPILDCVADMQVVLMYNSAPGSAPVAALDMSPFGNAAALRGALREIRIYIIAHEGQRDLSYQSPATIVINDADANAVDPTQFPKTFNVPDPNYRWKLYTLVVTPRIN